MKKFIGITVISLFLLSGCTLFGLGGPAEDASFAEAKIAQALSIDTLDIYTGYLGAVTENPESGEEYPIRGVGGTIIYSGDSNDFTLLLSGNMSGKISVRGVSFQDYRARKSDTEIKVSGKIETSTSSVTIRDVKFKFVTLGKKYLDGELWYYPEEKPNGVRVYTSDL